MRFHHILFLLLIMAAYASAQNAKPVANRVAAQNALFDEQHESHLLNFYESAPAVGDYPHNDKLGDRSLEAIAQYHKTDADFLARLAAIRTTGFTDQDQLSHDLLVRVLTQRITDFDLKEYEMPVNQQNGIHTSLADLPLSVPLDSAKHYEDYIARLHQIPRVLSQTTEVLRAGMKDRLMPGRFLLGKVPAQCLGVIAADPFLIPAKKFPDGIPAQEQARLRKEITEVVVKEVLPAYVEFTRFISDQYAPFGRTALAVSS